MAEIIPTKDWKKCEKRWLFIQKIRGNKTKWTNQEDEILKQLVIEQGARNWSNLANKLFMQINKFLNNLPEEEKEFYTFVQRNGKQCRERWLTALDPSINKSQWKIEEDINFLEIWL